MKNFIFIFLILFGFNCSADETISIVKIGPGMAESYTDAIDLARDTDNNIFIYFGADWCKYCTMIKKNTFENKEVKEYLLKNFVVLHVDIVTDVDKIKEKYNVRELPGLVVIDKNEKIIKRISGYKSPDKFLKWIKD
jgi:thioredoxin-related protein